MQSEGGLTPVGKVSGKHEDKSFIKNGHFPFYLSGVVTFESFFSFIGSRAIVSGPAGGVVGYAMTTYHRETELPVIGFDMGGKSFYAYGQTRIISGSVQFWSTLLNALILLGTSTDVSRYAGQYEHVFESTTAGVTIQAPQVLLLFDPSYVEYNVCV